MSTKINDDLEIITRLEDEEGRTLAAVVEPAGPQGRCRLIYVSGFGWTAEVNDDATMEDIEETEQAMRRAGIDWAQTDREGPVPAMDATGEVGFLTYYLKEV